VTPRSVPTPAREAALREVLPRMLSWVRGQRGTCRRLGADEAESIATLALWEALECHSPDRGPLWPFAKTVAERRLWDALRKQRRREVLAPEVSLEGLEDVCHHHALAAREVPDVETPLLLAEILALQAATYALALVDRPDDLPQSGARVRWESCSAGSANRTAGCSRRGRERACRGPRWRPASGSPSARPSGAFTRYASAFETRCAERGAPLRGSTPRRPAPPRDGSPNEPQPPSPSLIVPITTSSPTLRTGVPDASPSTAP
jgi:DNA-directed RNA polymerase specialized sigma24 family protein